VIDDARRRARRPAVATQDVPDLPARPDPEPFDPELVDALRRLTADQREVVLLRFVADLSLEEIARITRRRVGAIKSLQHRALSELATTVSPESRVAL
jgi:RNA polymerase sigma-70 factor (ECF subfamily)